MIPIDNMHTFEYRFQLGQSKVGIQGMEVPSCLHRVPVRNMFKQIQQYLLYSQYCFGEFGPFIHTQNRNIISSEQLQKCTIHKRVGFFQQCPGKSMLNTNHRLTALLYKWLLSLNMQHATASKLFIKHSVHTLHPSASLWYCWQNVSFSISRKTGIKHSRLPEYYRVKLSNY